ncbi:MAG TPA: 1-deoxy-D-xylulose-5-phosphate synthase, partial [Ruminococcaceae bacterium]|nr:1-deoxy-D-xylulose-5-phosphate synthase [Oscillospiraceae bacterium]
MLDHIKLPQDLKSLSFRQLDALCAEIRNVLIHTVSKTGGHLSSNLGVVELTVALHKTFHPPCDKIVWDVGHQSYTHKILTGRKDQFDTLRQFHGLSGFPKREESPCDAFNTGHSSTSISLGIGMVEARDRQKEDYTVVSVIGDGALTGGMAYEAMNNAARLQSNFIIILNDNNMSISESTGGLSKYLSRIRLNKGYNDLKQDVTNRLQRIPNIGDQLVSTISRTKSGLKQMLIPGMLF